MASMEAGKSRISRPAAFAALAVPKSPVHKTGLFYFMLVYVPIIP
jgi:hypothetical protein